MKAQHFSYRARKSVPDDAPVNYKTFRCSQHGHKIIGHVWMGRYAKPVCKECKL